ncbi:hypothetical protein PTKIN_Ptkin19aG0043000 [Pterospermum kingtungense]
MENKKERKAQAQPKRGLWKPEEDLILKNYVETHGEGNWATVSKRTGLKRGGKSCRLRWKNYLRPNIKRGGMSKEEEDLIIRMHKLLGNRWSLIAGRLPGRTDNEVKNYWNTHLNKKSVLGKRKTMDSSNNQQIENIDKVDDDDDGKELPLPRQSSSQHIDDDEGLLMGLELEEKKQSVKVEETQTETRFTDDRTWMERAVECLNYDYDYDMVGTATPLPLMMHMHPNGNYSNFVFDEQPFTSQSHLDSFLLFGSDVGIQPIFLP